MGILRRWYILAALSILIVVIGLVWWQTSSPIWSEAEVAALRALWIGNLQPLPPDPSNHVADDVRAAELGQRLFFDTRFSSNGAVACATCHDPARHFQDGLPLAKGVGTTTRRAMSIIGTAYSPWLFWDGRKDSQWAQALGPLESAVEHGGNRTQYAHLIANHYRAEYETLFGTLPDLSDFPASAGPVEDAVARAAWEAMAPEQQTVISQIYASMGKSIAAYERLILPGASRFDQYAEAVLNNDTAQMQTLFSAEEVAGLRLFIGSANCTQCHNGPLFTDNVFHNTGVPPVSGLPEDTGRTLGAVQVLADEFNCLGRFSDATPDQCAELRFMVSEGEELMRAFRPPSLRNVAERAPYMHSGQFATLEEVLHHYSTAPDAPAGHSEIEPLNLAEAQMRELIAFLHTLDGPVNADAKWLRAPEQ